MSPGYQQKLKNKGFTDKAVNFATMKSSVISLAYALARIAEPNNPKYSGSWTVTSPGSNTGNQSWTGASVNGLGTIIPGGTQAYASGLSNGDTVTLTLIEQ